MSLPSRLPAILQAVMQGQPRALADSHYPRWHHAPVTGLMNDPNGFVEFAGRYHLFYQWNPLACDHKFKCWGHWSSADLLHWQHEPIALMPDEEYDRNGCYSGSAVDNRARSPCAIPATSNLTTAAEPRGSAWRRKMPTARLRNSAGITAAGGLYRPRARPESLAA
jgi:sucrose-6-phosphate hydrolase SacC (GH32 family)